MAIGSRSPETGDLMWSGQRPSRFHRDSGTCSAQRSVSAVSEQLYYVRGTSAVHRSELKQRKNSRFPGAPPSRPSVPGLFSLCRDLFSCPQHRRTEICLPAGGTGAGKGILSA